jgi:ABC-type sulfate/molybdate transport systems ATPase subunit
MLITHDPEDVAALAQTVVVYDTGRIQRIMSREDAEAQWTAGLQPHFAV